MKMFRFIKPLLWILAIAIIIYVMYKVYNDVSKNMPGTVPRAKAESFQQQAKLKICLVYAVWCPHCEKYLDSNVFMSTYDELKKQPKYEKVTFVQIDHEKNKSFAEKYGISGFPSIVALSADGELLSQFNGDRNKKADLIDFVDENMGKV